MPETDDQNDQKALLFAGGLLHHAILEKMDAQDTTISTKRRITGAEVMDYIEMLRGGGNYDPKIDVGIVENPILEDLFFNYLEIAYVDDLIGSHVMKFDFMDALADEPKVLNKYFGVLASAYAEAGNYTDVKNFNIERAIKERSVLADLYWQARNRGAFFGYSEAAKAASSGDIKERYVGRSHIKISKLDNAHYIRITTGEVDDECDWLLEVRLKGGNGVRLDLGQSYKGAVSLMIDSSDEEEDEEENDLVKIDSSDEEEDEQEDKDLNDLVELLKNPLSSIWISKKIKI